MLNSLFKIVYLIEFVLITIARSVQTARYRTLGMVLDRKTLADMVFLALSGIGMLVPLVYVFSSALDFADYSLPGWVGWIGSIVFAFAIWLLWRSHADLGRNWTPTLGIREGHVLITDGVFGHIRHPMYAAHIVWGIAAALMLHNWIAGYAFLIASLAQYFSRVDAEEQMMLQQFGEEYQRYMERTGRLIPRFSSN
jgi:protein-S-isoprenylcysteine O-methyltransferase Ste14